MILRRHNAVRTLVFAALVGALTSCSENLAEHAVCEGGDGQVSIAWQTVPGIDSYRVFRANEGMTAEAIGEVAGASFIDANAVNGTRYGYIVRAVVPDGVEAPDLAACAVVPEAGDPIDVAAVADLSCRAKSGKVDLAWTPVTGAISYRVLRATPAATFEPVGEIQTPPFVDSTVVDGTAYQFAVVAVAADGSTAEPSIACSARPGVIGGGDPPAAVTNLACRGKRDKLDVTWTASPGAAFYRVYRSVNGAVSTAGDIANATFVDFGLPVGVEHRYAVRAVAADGTESVDSTACAYTATTRDSGNRGPQISSTPLTSALEHSRYEYHVIATDPEGDAVTLSTTQAPPGMYFEESEDTTNRLIWIPVANQVGPHTVELRATDPQGAYTTQAFVVTAADLNEPPRITSVANPRAQVGELYQYDVEAFDPEQAAVTYSFAEPAPEGMSIDPATGLISWTPNAPALALSVQVRAADAGGAFDTQTYQINATRDALVLNAPSGEFQVQVGDTLELRFVSNYAGSRFLAHPLPANATQKGDLFRFTPKPGQAGRYELIFKTIFSDLKASQRVAITVTESNLPPAFGAMGPYQVAEGGVLRVAATATDPDGDAIAFSAPGLSIENAVFDEFSNELIFQPSFEQAGDYDVALRASDGSVGIDAHVAISVTDAVPQVGDLDLVVNPPQSPTFVRSQTISGSVTGEVSSVATPLAALVTGLAPTNVQQGRPATIAITGRNTTFAQGDASAVFGDGITVDSFLVTSPTTATANISVSPTAPVGLRQMRVRSGGQEIPSVVAFRVEEGASIVRGVLHDSFTGQPLVGVRVTVNGTNASAVTGADGSFEILGVPPGAQTLVAVAPNFEVLEFAIAVEENSTYALDEPIGLRALARPAQPGGSLPRAQTLASVLDRGISTIDQPITHEQARLLILDTIVAAGVDQLGAIDETGAQVNPRIVGTGMLSLKPLALDHFADRLTRGEIYTLGQISTMLNGSLGWALRGLTLEPFLYNLQRAANEAWANAGDPNYALAIVVFNDRATLSPTPPILTADTRLNPFQTFLLISSVLVRNFAVLDMAFDQKLEARGIDPRQLIRDAGLDPEVAALSPHERPGGGAVTMIAARASSWIGFAGDLAFGAPAHAQTGGPTRRPPTFGGLSGGFANMGNGLPAAFISGGASVVFSALVVGTLAAIGILGPLAAFSLLATFLVGFISTLIAKFIGGFFQNTNLPDNYAPKPPAAISQVDPTVDEPNFYLRFRRSESDRRSDSLRRTNPEPVGWVDDILWNYKDGIVDERLLEHRYALWKFPCNPEAPDCASNASTRNSEPLARDSFLAPLTAGEIEAEPYLPDTERGIIDRKKAHGGEFEQFRVLKTRLSEGTNYFKIQTLQFYRRSLNGVDPSDEVLSIPWSQLGVSVPPPPAPLGPSSLSGVADSIKGNAAQDLANLTGLKLPTQVEREIAAKEAARARGHEAFVRELEEQSQSLFKLAGLSSHQVSAEVAERELRESLYDLDRQVSRVRTRVQTHINVVSALENKIAQPGATRLTSDELIDQLLDPSSPNSAYLRDHVGSGTGRDLFRQQATATLGEYRMQGAINKHSDTILKLERVRQDVVDRLVEIRLGPPSPEFGEIFPGTVENVPGRLSVEGAVVARSAPERVPITFEPISSQAQYDATLSRIDAEIGTQRGEIQRLQGIADNPTSEFRIASDARTQALQEHFYDKTQFDDGLNALKTKEAQFLESQRLATLQKGAADAEMRAATMKNFVFAGNPGQRGFAAARALRAELLDQGVTNFTRFKAAANPTAVGNLVGVALEVGTELHGLRSNIDLLASPLSSTIVVTAQTLAPDPITHHARIEVTSAPAPSPQPVCGIGVCLTNPDAKRTHASAASALPLEGDVHSLEAFAVADRFGAPSEPELPNFAAGLARGPLASLFRAPFLIDDAGRNPLGAASMRALQRVQFTGPAGAPIQFEPDPDLNELLAFLYPAGPPADNPRDGFLYRDYPFSPPQPERYTAGFPSELIAVDSAGRVYLENYNSNEQFGGRIFRFEGNPVVREHVGSVNYFSQSLMYAHPAFPVAMEIGDAPGGDEGIVEDLFVANKDLGIYFDAGRQPVNRILRVPIHLADSNPGFANGANRNRIVGQPWAEHPDFRFEGVTDLEVDRRNSRAFANGIRPLYLSDGDSLYVLRDTDADGSAETTKIAQVPGRAFSGIASDQFGNLFVADYSSGEVHLIPQQVLDDIVAGTQAMFASTEDLDTRGYLIKVELDRPGDIELDSLEHRYIVSTPGGLVPFDIPLVGRLPADVLEIRVDAIGFELPVTLRGSRGHSFMMGANSEGTFAGKDVRFRLRRLDAVTGESRWESKLVRTQPYSATVLRDDALVGQD